MAESAKDATPKGWPKHAIQMVALRVVRLSLEANLDVDPDVKQEQFALETANSDYDESDSTIDVRVRLRVGYEDTPDQKIPYKLEVELVGVFEVDKEKFPLEHVEHWARHNAPIILYPYLREHAMSTAIRGGFQPILLPLLEVPTFRLGQQPAASPSAPIH